MKTKTSWLTLWDIPSPPSGEHTVPVRPHFRRPPGSAVKTGKDSKAPARQVNKIAH